MSIAVRVSVWILGGLVVISAGVAVLALMQKQTLQNQNTSLHSQLSDDENRLADLTAKAKKLEDQAADLNSKITQAQQDKAQVQSQYDELKQKSDDLKNQLDQANSDRDDWKNRVDTISRERDTLMEKLKNQPTKIVYKTRVVRVKVPVKVPVPSEGEQAPAPAANVPAPSGKPDEYWASILRQKAALQIQIEKTKAQLDQDDLQVVELKKQNADLELEVKQLGNEKDEISQKIKYGQDLADNLSIDLARSRNDQQAVNERADKLKDENLQLLSQVRGLNASKLQLEQTVSRLTDEKDAMQKKLVETESVIQSRIDDIWKIKASLDKKLSENSATSSGSGMELPPIIVNAPNNAAAPSATAVNGRTQGTIISINTPNNFVIVDLGQQNSAIAIGNTLGVYRGDNRIATVQVIQVRRDISAADIKDKSTELRVGDVVKF